MTCSNRYLLKAELDKILAFSEAVANAPMPAAHTYYRKRTNRYRLLKRFIKWMTG